MFRLGKTVEIWFLKMTKIFSLLSVYGSDNVFFCILCVLDRASS